MIQIVRTLKRHGKFLCLCTILLLGGICLLAQINYLTHLSLQALQAVQSPKLNVPALEKEIQNAIQNGPVQVQTMAGISEFAPDDSAERLRLAQAFRFERIEEIVWNPTDAPAWEPAYILCLPGRFRILWESDSPQPQVVEVFHPGRRGDISFTIEGRFPREFCRMIEGK